MLSLSRNILQNLEDASTDVDASLFRHNSLPEVNLKNSTINLCANTALNEDHHGLDSRKSAELDYLRSKLVDGRSNNILD